jgi:hypothetical protein
LQSSLLLKLGLCLGLRIKEKLIIFSAEVTNDAHVQEMSSFSDLENVDALEANGQDGQQVVVHENTRIVSQVDEIVLEDCSPCYDPIRKPNHQECYFLNAGDAWQGPTGRSSVVVWSRGCGKDAIQVILRGQEKILANGLVGVSGQRDVVKQAEVALELPNPCRHLIDGIQCGRVGRPQRPIDE